MNRNTSRRLQRVGYRRRLREFSTATLMMLATAAASSAVTTIQPMDLSFTHRLGGLVPAHQIRLEVWEQDDVSADDFIGNYVTGNNGQSLVITNEDDGLFDNTLELYAYPTSIAPGYARVTPRAVGSNPYFYRSPGGTGFYPSTIDTTNPAVTLVPATNNTFGEAAFGILQPIVYTSQWFSANLSVGMAQIDVLYDSTNAEPLFGLICQESVRDLIPFFFGFVDFVFSWIASACASATYYNVKERLERVLAR